MVMVNYDVLGLKAHFLCKFKTRTDSLSDVKYVLHCVCVCVCARAIQVRYRSPVATKEYLIIYSNKVTQPLISVLCT